MSLPEHVSRHRPGNKTLEALNRRKERPQLVATLRRVLHEYSPRIDWKRP